MTWPAKAVAGLFVTLSIASSCSDPSSIGLDLDPNNNQIGVFYAEIPLSASMVLLDSFNTTNAGVMVVGGLTSDFFGTTEGIGFSRLAISPTVARPQQSAVLDSVKFNFQIESVIGNDLSTPKSLSVHLLTESILDTTYYNTDRLEFDPQPIAQGSFNFSSRQDTAVNVHMESGFSEFIFEELKKGDAFRDIFTFRSLIPGIAFQGDPSEETSAAIAVGSTTAITVYYKNEGDTISRGYTISTAQSRHFNYVNNDRTGTPTAEITEPRVAYSVGNRVGSISNVGIVMKLDTSPIDSFLDTLENVTFNDIELSIGPLGSNVSTNRPPQGLLMYFTNDQNTIERNANNSSLAVQREGAAQVINDNGSMVPAFGSNSEAILSYSSATNLYRAKITSHMNALYRLGLERRDFLLYPSVGLGSPDIFKRSFREFVVDENEIKLKIYYSKIRAF